jgi:hypothetical protein
VKPQGVLGCAGDDEAEERSRGMSAVRLAIKSLLQLCAKGDLQLSDHNFPLYIYKYSVQLHYRCGVSL